MATHLIHAVVLDLNFAGYGVVRSLTEYNIPVIGFIKEQDKHIPEGRTRLCKRKIQFSNNEELLELLLALPETASEKPVLYLSSDAYVNFFIAHRGQLEGKYLVNMPKNNILELLLDKNKFSVFALKHDILIPKSLEVNEKTEVDEVEKEICFPAIFKPYLRQQAWREARMPKAFFLASLEEFKIAYKKSMPYEKNMILQEWVPGSDDNMHFCLTYYGEQGDCLGSFSAYKIRQWPIGTGTASTAAPSEDDFIKEETQRIFKILDYQGFGAVEFKKSDMDGKFYLIEPSCRLDQTEYIATVNGVNIPLLAYNYLTGAIIQEVKPKKYPVTYIEEVAEFSSTLAHFKNKMITFKQWRKSLSGNKAYRYFNKKDLWVFGGIFLKKFLVIKAKII